MKQYLKGFMSFSLGTWFRAIISFFSTPVISYLIVPEEFGRASMFTLVYNITLLFSFMGLDQSFVRYYYEEEESGDIFWNCLLPSIGFGTIISVFFVIFEKSLSIVLYGEYYRKIGLLLAISLLIGVLQRFNQLSIRLQKKGFLFSLIDIISSLTNFGGTVFFALVFSKNFYAIVFGQVISNIVALIVGFLLDKEHRKLSKMSFEMLKEYLKYGIPFIPSSLLFWFFSSIDRISLRQFSNFTEIGLYSAAFKIVSVMQLIQAGFTTFWIPVAYEKYGSNDDSKDFFEKANSLISVILFIFGLFVLSLKDLVFMLFAKSYREASYIAPFLILYPIMYMISETTVLGINFAKKTYWHIVIIALSAFTNFVGNTLLVPSLGAKGAAISTGLSYILFFALRTIIGRKYYPLNINMKKIYFSTLLIVIVTTLGTFSRNQILYYIVCLLNLVIILLIYKNELMYMRKKLKN